MWMTTQEEQLIQGRALISTNKLRRYIRKKGGFNLQKWRTNNLSLQQQINKIEGDLDGAVPRVARILGLNWDTQEDCFVYNFDELISFIYSTA